jgi:hypothetical protein
MLCRATLTEWVRINPVRVYYRLLVHRGTVFELLEL